jgi:hypothetical protein
MIKINETNHHNLMQSLAFEMSKRDPDAQAEAGKFRLHFPMQRATFRPAAALASMAGLWSGLVQVRAMQGTPFHSQALEACRSNAVLRQTLEVDVVDPMAPANPPEKTFFTFQVDPRSNMIALDVSIERLDLVGHKIGELSIILEYFARASGRDVGHLFMNANHVVAHPKSVEAVLSDHSPDHYTEDNFQITPLINTPLEQWLAELEVFMDEGMVLGIKDRFFKKVAHPVCEITRRYMQNELPADLIYDLAKNAAEDWRKTLLGFALWRSPVATEKKQ